MAAEYGRLLILGGGGMVGLQVARESARELRPSEIIVCALTSAEVDAAVSQLTRESDENGWGVRFVAAPADIFIPVSLQGKSRAEFVRDRELFDELFSDIFAPAPDAYRHSTLYQLIAEHRPDLVVDCINTATAISYQDVYTTSRKVKVLLDRLEENGGLHGEDLPHFIQGVRELMIAQGVPQIVRHILVLHRALQESSVRVYVKVGTTGTGGMGINIPYTHSEDKPSPTLLSKSAIGFAHTGLLFLLARTPSSVRDADAPAETHGSIIKEVKPGAMIGFRRLGLSHVRVNGPDDRRQPGYLLEPKSEALGPSIEPRQPHDEFRPFEEREVPLKMVGADTGENGFFSIGEFQAITYPRQMEYVTPEEVARTVVLEILGASTGRDVLSAIDGAITEPSYRAGALRHQACTEMERLDRMIRASERDVLPSVAIGHLGPPRLSKLLIEAYLIRMAADTASIEELSGIDAETLRSSVESYLDAHPNVASLIATIGIPVLRLDDGRATITRGPRLNIPVPSPDGSPVPLEESDIERFASSGWVDLRPANFHAWRERLQRLVASTPDIASVGSAAFSASRYMGKEFVPGDIVGWLLSNEIDELGMVGRRLF